MIPQWSQHSYCFPDTSISAQKQGGHHCQIKSTFYFTNNAILSSKKLRINITRELYVLVNLVTVFVKSVRMGCNVAGLDDMTQTPNSQRVRKERIQQRINARTERIDTELLPV